MNTFNRIHSMAKVVFLAIIITAGISCGDGGLIGDTGRILSNTASTRGNDPNPTNGQSGSLAQFTINGDYFYSILDKNLKTFKIGQDLRLDFVRDQPLSIEVETIYPFEDYLLLGAESGVYIYKIGENGMPSMVSKFKHILSCDPVVAENNFAYVTLRAEGACRGVNRLDILDISDMNNPKLIHSENIDQPFGLAVHNDIVFVCQGNHGVSVFDVSDKSSPEKIAELFDVSARDVILDRQRKIAMFMGYGELIQLDYSNLTEITKISSYVF